jgi:hypothetical protein
VFAGLYDSYVTIRLGKERVSFSTYCVALDFPLYAILEVHILDFQDVWDRIVIVQIKTIEPRCNLWHVTP